MGGKINDNKKLIVEFQMKKKHGERREKRMKMRKLSGKFEFFGSNFQNCSQKSLTDNSTFLGDF